MEILYQIGIVIFLSTVSAILYHLGGIGKPWNTKVRDMGVAFVGVSYLAYLYLPFFGWKILLSYLLTFGLYFGSLTTYWKKKRSSALWWNWLLTGVGYSLAFLPFAFVSGFWLGFFLRLLVCSVATMIWSEKIGNAAWEEFGRGFIVTATIPLLLI